MCLHVPVLGRVGRPCTVRPLLIHSIVCGLAGIAKPRLPAQATKPLFVTTHEEKFSEKKKKKEKEEPIRTKFPPPQPPKKKTLTPRVNQQPHEARNKRNDVPDSNRNQCGLCSFQGQRQEIT